MRLNFPVLVFCAYNMVQPAQAAQAVPAGSWTGAMPNTLVTLSSPVIRVADLFSNAGPQANRILGASPAPGMRIVVGSDQLAAIAAAYQVPWTADGSDPEVVLSSPGRALAPAIMTAAIAAAVASAGGPPDAASRLPDYSPPMIPPGANPNIRVTGMDFDASTGNFSASVIIGAAGMAPQALQLSGLAEASVAAVVATASLPAGEVLSAADVTIARLPANQAVDALTDEASAIGMTTTVGIAAGAAVSAASLTAPILVAKGAAVVLSLTVPGLNLTAQGIALGAGGTGSVIPVLNAASHAVVQAVVTGPDTASIAPGSTPLTTAEDNGYAHYASYAQAHAAGYRPFGGQP
jgi:flagella basal body P-ring formation protein FlgA